MKKGDLANVLKCDVYGVPPKIEDEAGTGQTGSEQVMDGYWTPAFTGIKPGSSVRRLQLEARGNETDDFLDEGVGTIAGAKAGSDVQKRRCSGELLDGMAGPALNDE